MEKLWLDGQGMTSLLLFETLVMLRFNSTQKTIYSVLYWLQPFIWRADVYTVKDEM